MYLERSYPAKTRCITWSGCLGFLLAALTAIRFPKTSTSLLDRHVDMVCLAWAIRVPYLITHSTLSSSMLLGIIHGECRLLHVWMIGLQVPKSTFLLTSIFCATNSTLILCRGLLTLKAPAQRKRGIASLRRRCRCRPTTR